MVEAIDTQCWHRSRVVLWLSVLLVPPLALGLLWWQRRSGLIGRLLATVVLAGWSAVWVVLLLLFVFGLRAEVSGSAEKVFFSFESDEKAADRLEQHRREQQHAAAVSPPGDETTAEPAREPAAATEPGQLAVQASDSPGHDADGIRADGSEAAWNEGDESEADKSGESVASAAWPRLRGPSADGRYDEMPIASSWPAEGLTPLWRQPVGGGYASFVIAGGLAFTIEQRRDREVVVAYDLRTGQEVWIHGWQALFQERMGGDGPRATPSWHDGRLYVLGAGGELRALRATGGELLWRCNILEDAGAGNIEWGMAASPLVVDDAVIVQPGGGDGRSFAAYHRLNGELLWQSLDDRQAYTTPMECTLAGIRQLLVVSGERVAGLAPDDGGLLWQYPWETQYDVNAAQPLLIGGDSFLVSAGYGHGAALVRVVPGDGGLRCETVWESRALRTTFSSSVLLDEHVYGLDGPILVCLDVNTGKRLWKGKRYGSGQLLLAGDHLIVLGEEGELALVEARPGAFVELAAFPAIEGKTWNLPACGDGVLLVRNHREMAAFEL